MLVLGNYRVFEYTMTKNKHHFQIEFLPQNYTDVPSASFADVQYVVPVMDGKVDIGH